MKEFTKVSTGETVYIADSPFEDRESVLEFIERQPTSFWN